MRNKFTNKLALAFGALLMAAGFNSAKAQAGAALNFASGAPADQVVLPQAISTNSLVGGTKLTVEVWTKPSTVSGNGIIIGNYSTPANAAQFFLRRNGSSYLFWVGPGNNTNYSGVITGANTATPGVWQHIAGVYDGTVTTVYINGVFSASAATSANYTFATTTNSLIIGTNAVPESYDGDLDEIRIWNINRDRCQINTFMNCEVPSNAPNLIANYHFNQGTAAANNTTVTTLIDATSNAFNGTLANMALTGATGNWVTPGGVVSGFTTAVALPSLTISANPSLSTCQNNTLILTASGAGTYTWTGGVTNAVAFTATANTIYTVNATAATGCTATAVANVTANACPGAALSVDGANDIVNLGSQVTNSLVNTNKITLEAWVKPRSTSGNGAIISNYGTNGPPVQFILRRDGSNFTFFTNAAGFVQLTALATVTLNTWTHLAATWDGAVMRYYVNGIPSGSIANTGSFVASTSQIWIGGETAGPGEYFNGEIDEVRIWNTNRSRCEINTYMNCEIPANAANLMVNYHFNQGQAFSANPTATTLTDGTSNAITGTLTNMALTAGNLISNWVSPGGVVSGFTTALAAPGFTNSALAICPGGTVILGGTNGTSYVWTPTITNNVAFTPTASTSYTYAGTNSVSSCSVTSVANVTVNPNPTVTAVSSETNVLCSGQTATLTASGANTYVWNTTATTAIIAISPTTTTSYTVTGTDANGCQNTATVTQNVSSCTGMAANSADAQVISIYPNPSSGAFNVNVTSDVKLAVYDIIGNLIFNKDLTAGVYKLDLTEYRNGMYVVKCTSNGQLKSYRLIKE